MNLLIGILFLDGIPISEYFSRVVNHFTFVFKNWYVQQTRDSEEYFTEELVVFLTKDS